MALTQAEAGLLTVQLRDEERTSLQVALARALAEVPNQATFALSWARPDYRVVATVGFVGGFCDGFVTGAEEWVADLKRLFRLVGIGTVVSISEFFVRPVAEQQPRGLLPQTRQAVESLNAIHTLGPIVQWLDAVGPAQALATLRDLLPSASDLAQILGRATGAWLIDLARKVNEPYAAGFQIGRLVGRAVLEVIRALIEPDAFGIGAALETPMEPTGADAPAGQGGER